MTRAASSRLRSRGAEIAALALAGLSAVVAPGFAAAGPGGVCAGLRDDDHVRPIPRFLAANARKALGLAAEATDDDLVRTTVYRCMDGVAWVCNHGANLTCDRANAARTSAGADAWCKANPGSTDVPDYATGHDTLYAWTCAGTKAVAGSASPVDERGFFADQWKPIRE